MDPDVLNVPSYAARSRVDGRGYVVVGAGNGMGRQVCHALKQLGAARIVCADLDEERATSVAGQVEIGIPWVGDISDPTEAARLAGDAEALLESVDGLVDIVGGSVPTSIGHVDAQVFEQQFALNLWQALNVTSALRTQLERSRGSVVYVSSVSGIYASPQSLAYGAAKAGLIAAVKSMAVEMGPAGVRVNSVAPGRIVTPRMIEKYGADEFARQCELVAPLRRAGEPSDIAGAIMFLLSDLASYVTGETLVVDGGFTALGPAYIGTN